MILGWKPHGFGPCVWHWDTRAGACTITSPYLFNHFFTIMWRACTVRVSVFRPFENKLLSKWSVDLLYNYYTVSCRMFVRHHIPLPFPPNNFSSLELIVDWWSWEVKDMATISLQWRCKAWKKGARNATIPPGMVAQSEKSLFLTIFRCLFCFAFCLLCHATTTMGLNIGMFPINKCNFPYVHHSQFLKKRKFMVCNSIEPCTVKQIC